MNDKRKKKLTPAEMAREAMRHSTRSAVITLVYSGPYGDIDLGVLMESLRELNSRAKNGDLGFVEGGWEP